MKVKIFLGISGTGVLLLAAEFAILQLAGAAGWLLTTAGVCLLIGGLIGAGACAKSVREKIGKAVELVLNLWP